MRFDEYRKHDATALAGLIAKREVSAGDVLEIAIARAEQVNPAINAIVHKQYEKARKAVAAGPPQGPLAGVPYLHQGSRFPRDGRAGATRQQPVQGFRGRSRQRLCGALQEGGSGHLRPHLDAGVRPQPQHRAAPQRSVPQSVEPGIFGRRLIGRCRGSGHCRRSSGGARDRRRRLDPNSGRAVRPVRTEALARARVVRARLGRRLGRAVGGHVVSRSVRDSALMLDCTAGTEPGDPYAAPTPERPFVEALGRPPGKLRIALMLKDHRGAKLHPETREGRAGRGQAMREPRPHRRGGGSQAGPGGAAADECQDRGSQHRAHPAPCAGRRWDASPMRRMSRRQPGPSTSAASRSAAVEYVEAIAAVHAAGRRMAAFLTSYDVILSTVLAGPPPKLGYLDQNSATWRPSPSA